MLEKAKNYWASLNREITVNQRELVLGIAVCALAGVVIGTMLSPNIHMTIGSNNCIHENDEEAETAETGE